VGKKISRKVGEIVFVDINAVESKIVHKNNLSGATNPLGACSIETAFGASYVEK